MQPSWLQPFQHACLHCKIVACPCASAVPEAGARLEISQSAQPTDHTTGAGRCLDFGEGWRSAPIAPRAGQAAPCCHHRDRLAKPTHYRLFRYLSRRAGSHGLQLDDTGQRMQLRHLSTFAAVADTLNFTRAAERVHLSQSSVTEQIQSLEAELGARLFDRSRRRLSLTPAGQRLQAFAAELLKLAGEARAAVAEASDTVAGSLVIGGLETLCAARLPELIAEFHRRHAAVELTLKTADSGSLRRGIRNGDLDAGFFFGEAPEETDVRSEALAEEQLLIILPPNHRLAGRTEVGPEDLANDAFLVTQPGCIYRRMFDEAFAILPKRPKPMGEFASLGLIRGLVEAGLGCALVPRSALAKHPGHVVAIPWSGRRRTAPVTMMWRHRRVYAPALAAFLATARECL
ncbi:LysR family transcriptional regulator [Mesorhizobium sp. L-8-3]|uniref:LysR family transcriptional regulator n=1 Tax=Mesorhizobium sp. L-8-3 TaxID=2744522 RepID=UPI001FD582AA|nr:LysR family transcriptional regulator [Mesorhizobium sp. L-8-3]